LEMVLITHEVKVYLHVKNIQTGKVTDKQSWTFQ
jgi:hypothetical protein